MQQGRLAGEQRIQSAQPWGNPNGPLEDSHRPQTDSAQLSQPKNGVGLKLTARSFPNQKMEAKIGTHILNKMTELGRAKFEAAA